jgi:hypothetical protein
MSEEQAPVAVHLDNALRARVLVIGGVLGTILGIVSAILYLKAAEESAAEDGVIAAPAPQDAVKLGLSLLGIIRAITDWAKR